MVVAGRSMGPPPPPVKPHHGLNNNDSNGEHTAFSVSAAKAFFEAAKKPEVRQAAVAAAKNPLVRSMAKSAAQNPETRNQLIAALEKHYGGQSASSKPSPPAKPKHHEDSTASPPPPPPHRSTAASPSMTSSVNSMTSSASSYSSPPPLASYKSSNDYKPLPTAPSTSSTYYGSTSSTNGNAYPSLVDELRALHVDTQGTKKAPPPRPPPASSKKSTGTLKPIRLPPPIPPTSRLLNGTAVSPSQPHAIVKYSFNGSHVDELSCAAGDTVVLKRDVDDQWIYGMNSRTGAHGIIPLSYLDIRVPLTSGYAYNQVIATAIYDFQSDTPGDLSFRVNDQITATERVGTDWLRGTLNGREGIFPANFVSCPGMASLPLTPASAQPQPMEQMTAAYDYSSGVAGDLEFRAGDTIQVIAHLDQDWIRGRVNGQEGLAPLSFLAPYGTPVKSPKTRGLAAIAALGGGGKVVTAIADHASDDPKMLYFSKGDKIVIVEDVDSYWYKGKVEGFKTLPPGLFPKALVKED